MITCLPPQILDAQEHPFRQRDTLMISNMPGVPSLCTIPILSLIYPSPSHIKSSSCQTPSSNFA